MIEFVRTATNPWAQEVLVGIAWDLMWVGLAAGVLFALGHAVWYRKWAPPEEHEETPGARVAVGGEERVEKYTLAERLFHWIMAGAMLVLLVTAFFPVAGIQFPWVTIHWIAGVVLTLALVYHVVHTTVWLDFWSMWVDRIDVENGVRTVKRMLGRDAPPPRKDGKYALPNKLFHHATALFGLAVVVTGFFMMFRVETPFWTRDPYLFSDRAWGWIYVLHGVAAVAFITMVMAHIYFAVRPEKLWMTRSMILGWITGREYADHHDPERWPAGESAGQRPSPREPAGAPAGARAEAGD